MSARPIDGRGFAPKQGLRSRRNTEATSSARRSFRAFTLAAYRSATASNANRDESSRAARSAANRFWSATTGSIFRRTMPSSSAARSRACSAVHGLPCCPIVARRVGDPRPPMRYCRMYDRAPLCVTTRPKPFKVSSQRNTRPDAGFATASTARFVILPTANSVSCQSPDNHGTYNHGGLWASMAGKFSGRHESNRALAGYGRPWRGQVASFVIRGSRVRFLQPAPLRKARGGAVNVHGL